MFGVMNGLDWIVSPKAPLCHRKLSPNLRWSIQLCWSCPVHVSYFLRSDAAFFLLGKCMETKSISGILHLVRGTAGTCPMRKFIMFHGPFDPTPGWVYNTLGLRPRNQSYLTGSCVPFACWLCGEQFDQWKRTRPKVACEHGLRFGVVLCVGRWKARPSDSCSNGDVGRSERDTPDPLSTNRREDNQT